MLFFILISILSITNSISQTVKIETKILAVHSYSSDFPWTKIILQNYEEELRKSGLSYNIKNIYFDIKKHPFALDSKHPLYENIENEIINWKPSLLFLTDDYSLHQVGRIAIKRNVPFIFSGLNGKVPDFISKSKFKLFSGVYERYYVLDTLRLLQKLLNKDKIKVLFLFEKSETADFVIDSLNKQMNKLKSVKYEIFQNSSFDDWKKRISEGNSKFDAFFPLQPFGLSINGEYQKTQDVISWLSKNSLIPTLYTSGWQIRCGGTLAIAHRPASQGIEAAKLTLKVLANKFPSPVTPPQGDIEINFAVTEKLKIKIPFDLLTSANITKKIESPCSLEQ